ncbi:MAG: DUF3135 domain-containing protein [Burkholderiales bacterium]|nr:DUF3135 domain-containing protein [Burkholderiales bacterium]
MDFDFDRWAKLAKEDPAEFERRRDETLRAIIAAAPPQHRDRLQGLQFRLDLERKRAGSPLASCLRLNSLMWAGFHRLRKELNEGVGGKPAAANPRPSAEVIPLRRGR